MRVVTSTFENKTADALRQISANLIPVEPTTEAIKAGSRRRSRSLGDREGRVEAAGFAGRARGRSRSTTP